MAPGVLRALDSAKIQYYHFKAVIIAGMGLFTDAYDLFCISPVVSMIGRIYHDGGDQKGDMDMSLRSLVVGMALLGTVIGNLVFGLLGDRMGRKRVYGLALLLMVFSSIASGFSICHTKNCVITSLCFFRFWLGVGIGADYPLSATIMSEFANKKTRGSFIAAVFSMQGFGILTSSAVTMAICAAFDHFTVSVGQEADLAWRLILIFGAIPAGMTYYWRMKMPETARYTALVEMNVRQAAKDMEMVLDGAQQQITNEFEVILEGPSYGILSKQFFRRHGRDLFACATAWCLIDIVFYSSNLFQPQIYQQWLRKLDSDNTYRAAFRVARLECIVAICSTVPGYWVTIFLIDHIGRVKIQIIGFFFMGICLFAIGIPHKYWSTNFNHWFFLLCGLTLFFSNFGPNTTTFIIPAELFPARFRSTCHGISGASGKIGALIGSLAFMWAAPSSHGEDVEKYYDVGIGMHYILVAFGVICFVGVVLTYFFTPETRGRSLEENENE